MARPNPTKIIVQFDDGTQKEAAFEELTTQAQFELSKQPVLFQAVPNGENKKFVLLEWKDGWKEVKAVDTDCKNINRYTVISRPEDVGRLSLDKKDGYPELLEIGRTPLDLKQIGFVESFEITLKKSDREGKKTDHFFSLNPNGGDFLRAAEDFKNALTEEGIKPKTLSTENPLERRKIYTKIAGKMGVRAFDRQQDVLDFIDYLAHIVERN